MVATVNYKYSAQVKLAETSSGEREGAADPNSEIITVI